MNVYIAVAIPVIGNGDVCSADDALRMMRETGCDYVMVARAALGNPWIFREMNEAWNAQSGAGQNCASDFAPAIDDKKEVMLKQLHDMCDLKGEYCAVREMRKVIGWYIKGLPGSAAVRRMVNDIDTLSGMEDIIEGL